MARYSLNYDRLSGAAADAARDAGLGPTCTNPFRSIIVRAIEVLYACDEALRLIGGYQPPDPRPSTCRRARQPDSAAPRRRVQRAKRC